MNNYKSGNNKSVERKRPFNKDTTTTTNNNIQRQVVNKRKQM